MGHLHAIIRTSLLGLTLAAPTSALHGQAENLPKLDVSGIAGDLAVTAKGLAEGCDYLRYLRTADQLYAAFEEIRDIRTIGIAKDNSGVPFTDYVKIVMDAVSNRLNIDAAKSLRKGLILQIEQTCNTIIQGDEVRRILEVTRDGQLGVQEMIPALSTLFGKEQRAEVDTTVKFSVDSAFYASARFTVPRMAGSSTDSMMIQLIERAEQTTRFASLALMAIDSIEENLRKIQDQAYLFAEPDSSGTMRCPEGYPPPQMRPDLTRIPKPICGPAGSERSIQLLRATAEEHLRLKIIDSRTIPLMATLDAYSNVVAGHDARVQNSIKVKHVGF